MADGTRTRDHRDHNPGLYQLSYRHRAQEENSRRSCRTRPAATLRTVRPRCQIRPVPDHYVPSPAWRISFENDLLVLNAGADHLFAIDQVNEATAAELLDAWERGRVSGDDLSPRAREVVEELAASKILVDRSPQRAPRVTAVRWVGHVDPGLDRHLQAGIAESPTLLLPDGQPDVTLVVRTNCRLVELYEAGVPSTPHLLLDVAYHHTVSLGPLVVLGETACLGCLAGRIGACWGDPVPPDRPAMVQSPALGAALAVRELEAVAADDVRLANTTAAYDLRAHHVSLGAVYKLPWCPTCGDRSAPRGDIDLPWASAA